MSPGQTAVQIGKNGLTDNLIETIRVHFTKRKNVKVSVLRGGEPNKEKIKEMSEKILSKLGPNFTARIVGFTIFLKKWRSPVDKKGQKR